MGRHEEGRMGDGMKSPFDLDTCNGTQKYVIRCVSKGKQMI